MALNKDEVTKGMNLIDSGGNTAYVLAVGKYCDGSMYFDIEYQDGWLDGESYQICEDELQQDFSVPTKEDESK